AEHLIIGRPMMRLTAFVCLCVAVMVTACGGVGLAVPYKGRSEAELVTVKGPPTGRYALPDGQQRLEFARGPQGRQTFMADVDSHGRVIRFEQVLDVRRFALVTPGATRDGVLRTIGQPSDRAPLRDGEMWAWRYANRDCVWYEIELDQHGVVKATGFTPEPGCNDVAGASSMRVGGG
ncbi:MAG TPA: hypothetical protein VFU71_18450, partial [Burkholderiaceae bacterium]|nr:hypothetical protein [Burkholderiaceae bacterium]